MHGVEQEWHDSVMDVCFDCVVLSRVFVRETNQLRALTPWCTSSCREVMARELMAITGLTAQEFVDLAHSAFGVASAIVGATGKAARAAAMGIFGADGSTGDGFGLCLIGNPPSFV